MRNEYNFQVIEFGEIVLRFVNSHPTPPIKSPENDENSLISQELISKLNSGKLMEISPCVKAKLINNEINGLVLKYGAGVRILIYSLPKNDCEAKFLPVPDCLVVLATKDKKTLFERAKSRRVDTKKTESNHHVLKEYNLDVDNNLFKHSISNQKIEKNQKKIKDFEFDYLIDTKKEKEKEIVAKEGRNFNILKKTENCWKDYPLKRIGDDDKLFFEMRIERFERRWEKIALFYKEIEKERSTNLIFEFDTTNNNLDTIANSIIQIIQEKEEISKPHEKKL